MRQKKPDQRPEVFRKFYESEGIIIDGDKILDFINEVGRFPYTGPSKENAQVVSALLVEMIQAAKYGEEWEPYKKRIGVKKITDKGFDPSLVTINEPAFGLVMAYVDGKISHKVAKALFIEEIYPCSPPQAERHIKAIKPRAESVIAFRDKMLSLATIKK